jgi:SAM-dependent methyltransferase
MLASGKSVELIYAGDRMAPALRHGQAILLEAPAAPLAAGEVVVASPEGVPDVYRIEAIEADQVRLAADADPAAPLRASRELILARVRSPARRLGPFRRSLHRISLELLEAWRGRPDPAPDIAATVRLKYDIQAPFYAGASGPDLEESLRRWLVAEVPRGSRILVAGSGTGRECFALAREGYDILGVDFSVEMISRARQEAGRLGLPVSFHAADLRAFRDIPGPLGAVLFTYEVYSFLPVARERRELLRTMASWLQPEGKIFLSARRARGAFERLVLSIQWLRAREVPGRSWGDSHSRWIAPDGALRRSFIHVFPERQLGLELRGAGLRPGKFRGGHVMLSPGESRSTST